MNNDYYKEYYDIERQHWWFLAREKILSNYIQKLILNGQLNKLDLKILNVGCGTGRSSEYLSEYGTVFSIEFDKDCCNFTSQKTGLEIINASVTELPFKDESFDLVCAFDVIEHVENDQLAVFEMKRVVKKNGIIFITVPAFMALWSHHDLVNHHFRRYKLNEIQKLFYNQENGKMVFTSYFNFFLFIPIYLLRKISNLLKFDNSRPGSGSDFATFKSGILSSLLFKVMFFENIFINNKIKLPFGVSLLYSWTKIK